MIWENAKITSTFIGIEDHGIFAWNIDFAGPGWGQGTGAYGFSASMIESIVRAFGPWEALEGQVVRIGREGRGRILGMRDILDDTKEVMF